MLTEIDAVRSEMEDEVLYDVHHVEGDVDQPVEKTMAQNQQQPFPFHLHKI